MKRRPRILYISPCFPDGPRYGTQIRALNVGRALEHIGDVSFAVVGFPGDEQARQEFRSEAVVVERFFQLHSQRTDFWRTRAGTLIAPRSLKSSAHTLTKDAFEWLEAASPDYDLIWVHNVRSANAFQKWRWPRTILDIDDVPSTYLRAVAQNVESLSRRFFLHLRMLVARKRERLLAERFSVLSVCSEEDRAYLNLSCPVHVIPNGFAADQSGISRFTFPHSALFPPRIGFIGTFDYEPNCDGVRWFLRSCWADLKREIPSLELRLIGRNPEKIEASPLHDVYTCGYLDQADEEMESWSVLIVPLQIGAGSRVKVADGFSRKIPIVATEVGAFGYAVSSGQELLIANSASDFVNACKLLIRNSEFAAQLAEKAYIRFLNEWSWEAIKPRVWNAAEDCLRFSTEDSKRARAERSTI